MLPSRLTSSGDRDGLPNVLMEAQAFAVPVLSTDVSGIPELVTHGENGWLVPEKNPQALAEALRLLLADPTLRRRTRRCRRSERSSALFFRARHRCDCFAASKEPGTARRRMTRDSGGAKERFAALIDEAAARPERLAFWWRDDDAESVSAELDTLLALASRFNLPLGLAVIPKGADQLLAACLAHEPAVRVLQHGWQHRSHSRPGEKKMELGDSRPLSEILAELTAGRERLAALFPAQFLPVLVPPWNRIAPSVETARLEVGLPGLSAFGPAHASPHCVNTHIDPFDWHGSRGLMPHEVIYATACSEVERRLSGDSEPIGLLTHHLIHQSEAWKLLQEFLAMTAAHPAIEWRSLPALFGLPDAP